MLVLLNVLERVRPAVPRPLVPPLDLYLVLLGELLLRGSSDQGADVERLDHELDDPETLVCVRENVVGWEFARVVKTVGDDGPGPLFVPLKIIWPPIQPRQAAIVNDLGNTVKQALGELLQMDEAGWFRRDLAPGWHLPPEPIERRGRGRPSDPATKSLLAMGAREGLFNDRARPYAVARAISAKPESTMTHASAYRRLNLARAAAPIPAGWKATLWHERIQPLHVDHFRAPRPVVGRLLPNIPDD